MHSAPGGILLVLFTKVSSSVLQPFQLRMGLMWMQIPAKVTRLFDVSVRRVLLAPVTPSLMKNRLTPV